MRIHCCETTIQETVPIRSLHIQQKMWTRHLWRSCNITTTTNGYKLVDIFAVWLRHFTVKPLPPVQTNWILFTSWSVTLSQSSSSVWVSATFANMFEWKLINVLSIGFCKTVNIKYWFFKGFRSASSELIKFTTSSFLLSMKLNTSSSPSV